MLIDFKCSNYYSFYNEISFSTLASGSIVPEDNNRYHYFNNKSYNKVSSLYGKNGAGKTTLICALDFLKDMVINSSKDTQEGEDIDVAPFAFSEDSEDSPSTFEISFIQNDSIYKFGLKTTTKKIVEEYLYGQLKTNEENISKRETLLFHRTETSIDLGRRFNSINKFLSTPDIELRDNSLLLSYSAQMGLAIAKEVVDWFRKLKISFEGNISNGFTASILQNANDELYDDVMNFLLTSDLGITSIRSIEQNLEDYVEGLPEEFKKVIMEAEANKKIKHFDVKTQHTFKSKNGDLLYKFLDLKYESDGVNKMFSLAGPIIDCLYNGYIFIIDEIETNLHFMLTRKIIEMFNSKKNSKGAQLIFSTHSPLLMDLEVLDRDQMWIVSLNNNSTQLKRLADSFRIRKDTNVVKKIIDGEYDSAPVLT